MRIWSLHPKYLDSKGIVALWRESLLAKNVLEGNTIGYTRHPQLSRFINSGDPLVFINLYLKYVFDESLSRNYKFDRNKFIFNDMSLKLTVTSGQVEYEFKHLLNISILFPMQF